MPYSNVLASSWPFGTLFTSRRPPECSMTSIQESSGHSVSRLIRTFLSAPCWLLYALGALLVMRFLLFWEARLPTGLEGLDQYGLMEGNE